MPDLWPFVPMPDITETLVWGTDVCKTRTGEFRTSLHGGRQILNYTYHKDESLERFNEQFRSNITNLWDVPVWTESSKPGAISALDTVINADMTADYTDRALIFEDRNTYQVVDIDSVGANLTLTQAVGTAYTNPTVAPIREAYAPQGMQITKNRSGISQFSMSFRSTEISEIGATTLPQYQGLDYFRCAGAIIGQVQGGVVYTSTLHDSGLGSFTYIPNREIFEPRYGALVNRTNRASRWELKQWLYYLRGRDRALWIPAWGGEMVLASPASASDTTILVEPILSDITLYSGKHVALGNGEFREITGATVDGSNHRLDVAALSETPTQSPTFIRKVRLDTDSIEVRHVRDFSMSVSLVFLEVPE